MAQRQVRKLQAFTILEITVVVAICFIFVTIIKITLNLLNEQIKINGDIQQELNDWMLVRSNFWYEYHHSDSVYVTGGELFFSQPHRIICYKVDDDQLKRKEVKTINVSGSSVSGEWVDIKVTVSSIKEDASENQITVTFPLKGDDMNIRFPKQINKSDVVNRYYEQLLNE